VTVPKKEKKAPVNFIKQNILASKSKYQRPTGVRNRMGVMEFPVDDASYNHVRSMSSRGSQSGSEGGRSNSQNFRIGSTGFTMNIYKQVNKPLPKPGIFISGSRTGREPLPREVSKTIKVDGSSLDFNVETL
jgi:hypothetical protein